MQIVLEHLTICATSEDRIDLVIERVPLPPGTDPVDVGFAHAADALSHSTSWRADGNGLILTFAHVVPDGSLTTAANAAGQTWQGSPEELEALPAACNAVRHLHFLRFMDEEIGGRTDLDLFWAYAHAVADHHYPAVAGLLFTHGLAGGPDYVI